MRSDSSPNRKRVLKRADGVSLLVAVLAASTLAVSTGACRHRPDATADASPASRVERIAVLEHAIASDHATLETLLSRPRADASPTGPANNTPSKSASSSMDANAEPLTFADADGLHRDPRVLAIAERLTVNRGELSVLQALERAEFE